MSGDVRGQGDDSKNTRYRALLPVDVKNKKHTELLKVGGDFEDIFG